MKKLNQVIAIEKEVKARTLAEITEQYKNFQKSDLFSGFSKVYRPLDEEGEQFAPENKKVICNTTDMFNKIQKKMSELFDITCTKDCANTEASADIIVDGQTIVKNVPSTFIIFLEKQLIDIRTMIKSVPTLDINEDWNKDPNSNLYKTKEITTHRTKKMPKVIIRYQATKEHPAQTDLVSEDVLIGYWNTVKLSGALPVPIKEELLDRVNKLMKAVKVAREEANSIEINNIQVGDSIFSYLFK